MNFNVHITALDIVREYFYIKSECEFQSVILHFTKHRQCRFTVTNSYYARTASYVVDFGAFSQAMVKQFYIIIIGNMSWRIISRFACGIQLTHMYMPIMMTCYSFR